jgi:hypothetical protein
MDDFGDELDDDLGIPFHYELEDVVTIANLTP